MLRFGRAIAAVVLLTAVLSTAAAAQAPAHGTYIVVLDPGVANVRATADGLARAHGGQVGFVYEHALRGFSVRIAAQGAAGIARNPQVAYVEADQVFTVSAQTTPTGIQRIFAPGNTNLSINGVDDKRVDVDVAIIDTGIDLDHPDLVVAGGVNCAGGGPFTSSCGSGGDDGNGHGTHVAGTVAAIDNGSGVVGVAPGARLWAVRVLDNNGSGWTSWIVAGMDWVTANKATIQVANMSLGGGGSSAIDDAAKRMYEAGVALAVAAGNSDDDAGNYSPARAQGVQTVSALADFDGKAGALGSPTCRTDQDDTLADFSNWGSTIEITAPGVCILSTWLSGGYNTISGTSMASPHVAGGLALLASKGFNRNASGVQGLYDLLESKGNSNWTDDGGPNNEGDGTKEPLLDVSDATTFDPKMTDGSGGGGDTNSPPTASFTFSCSSLTCSFDGSGSTDSDGSITSYSWNFGDNTTGSGSTTSHTYGAGGTYNVTLTVQDDDGATGSQSKSVAVSSTGLSVSLANAGSVNNGSSWTGRVDVTVTDGGVAQSGVKVEGTWSNGTSGTGTCMTESTGTCRVEKGSISKRVSSVTFTVDELNDSTSFGGTKSITVSKP